MKRNTSFILAGIVTLGAAGASLSAVGAGAAAETFAATATVKGAQAPMTAPVTIVVERFTTDAERTAVVEALKTGGSAAVKQALSKMPSIGQLTVGERKTAVKYAYARPVGGGRMVTVISDQPLGYLARATPAPKAGFDLAFALLTLPASGKGTGEIGPAAKIKIEGGALVTEDYGAEVVTLSDVEPKH
jgi:hypothetical protein